MKKLNKYAKAGIIVCFVAVLLATSLWGNGSVEASPSRMSGVQKIINDISETDPFTVVELVPDKSDASFGFLVKGYEPQVPGALLKTVTGKDARKQIAIDWLNEHAGGNIGDGETMISYVGSSIYEEQLYKPENINGWTTLYFNGKYTEQRTGSFKESVDYGLEKGSYDASGNYVGEDLGDYVWVDGEGSTQNVEIHRIYCRMNYTSNNWFAEKVLESEDAYVTVKTMTPKGFESMLNIGGLSWENVDLLYLNASNETKYVNSGTNANDFANWSTCVQIYNQAIGAKLPMILDDRIMQDASDEGTNIRNLAYLLKAYDANLTVEDPLDETTLNQAKEKAAAKTQPVGVCENVYFGTKFVDISLVQKLDDFYGKDVVVAEFENENFYHEVNDTDYTAERTQNGTYNISNASLIKYTIHTGNKRVETTKEKIRVLDIEPTKYSLLKESDVRSWLGEDTDESQLFEIELIQTTVAEFNGVMTDLVESYDMIYIGSYDGPAFRGTSFTGGLNVLDGSTVYNDSQLNGLIYSDLGDMATVPSEFAGIAGSKYDNAGNLITRYSGNDITDMKLQELKEFVKCGYPVIISNALYKGNSNTIDTGKVKDTSNMYAFMQGCTGSNAVGNVMKQGTTKPATLSRYANISKLTMSMLKAPVEYELNYADNAQLVIDSVNGLKPGEELQYSFEFSDDVRVLGDGMYYKLQLYIDNDADGQYSDYEELYEVDIRDINGNKVEVNQVQPGQRYWVTKELGDSYRGVLSWKLKVALFDAEDKELSARSSKTGTTFVSYESNEMIQVNALQVKVSDDGLSLTEGTVGNLLNNLAAKGIYNISVTSVTAEEFLAMTKNSDPFHAFDMLIIGFADNYAEATVTGTKESIDTAILEIEKYIEEGNAVLFSHDTTSYKNLEENYWGYALNQLVRKTAGMDHYDVLSTPNVDADGNAMDMSGKEGFANMILDANAILDGSVENSTYKSLAYSGSDATAPTSRISQVNVGQITSFPYDVNIDPEDASTYLSDMIWGGDAILDAAGVPNVRIMTPMTMGIKETTGQFYQLDLDCDRDGDGKSDLIVWYSLAGAIGGEGNIISGLDALLQSNAYAAMPNDVRNNYYIYSLGNVTYTAMGYSTDLSDYEAKLLVNTLIAAHNLGLKEPVVNILNDKEDKGSIIHDVYRPFDDEAGIFCESDQDIYFHVKDSNVIDGSKKVTINAYYEVDSTSAYDKKIIDANNAPIYLRSFSVQAEHDQKVIDQYLDPSQPLPDEVPPDELLTEGYYLVDDHVYELTVDKDKMNSVLGSNPSMKIYIGVQVDYNHESGRTDSQETYAILEIKKMSLFNLD